MKHASKASLHQILKFTQGIHQTFEPNLSHFSLKLGPYYQPSGACATMTMK